MAEIPELRTERLLLRGFTETDRAPFAALNADPEVMEYFPATLSPAQSDAVLDRFRDEWTARGYGMWIVEAPGEQSFAGVVGLAHADFRAHFTPCVEIGWRLARPAWGHGWASEAARAALQFGFETLGLSQIVAMTATTNLRSQRVMQRLGMARDPGEDFDHPRVPVGSPLRRHVLYRIWPEQAKFAHLVEGS